MNLYLDSAAPDEPVVRSTFPPQGGGRLNNPDLFSVLFLSSSAAGAVAEALGAFPNGCPRCSMARRASPKASERFPAIASTPVRVCVTSTIHGGCGR